MRLVRYPFISNIFFPKAIKSFPAQAGRLFLTFDDGPNENTTPVLLNILKKYSCKATFFCLGEAAIKYPELINAIKNDRHTIGNHGFSHINGFKLSTSEFIENIDKANLLLQTPLFRPPYGKMTLRQYRTTIKHYDIVLWDIMSYDFDPTISVQQCVNRVLKNIRNGSIIVFHDNEKSIKRTEKALPLVIEHFQKQGCLFNEIPSNY